MARPKTWYIGDTEFLGASKSWSPKGLSWSVMGWIWLAYITTKSDERGNNIYLHWYISFWWNYFSCYT